MFRTLVTTAALAIALAGAAYAHGPKGAKPVGANGGEIVDVESGHLELVTAPDELRIYITDLKDAPLGTEGLAGRAVVLDGTKQLTLPLVPKTPNILAAPLAAPLSKDAKVAVSATLSKDGKPVQARFVVK